MKYIVIAIMLIASAVACFVMYGAFSQGSGIRAICRDGSVSKSKTNKGTCAHHGGVHQWTIGER